VQTYTFKEIDGCTIGVDVHPGLGDSPRPAVMFIHGGGLILGSRSAVPPVQIEALHRSGFDLVSIDYRLAPETPLPGIVSDVEDAWAWLRREAPSLGIDADRIAVLGHSAGGFLSLLCGFRLDPRPCAVVSLAGYGRLVTEEFCAPNPHHAALPAVHEDEARAALDRKVLSAGGPGDSIQRFLGRGRFYLFCRQRGTWLTQVSGHDQRDLGWFETYEPVRHVSPEYPPTLLVHGEQDVEVRIEQSESMRRELARHGVIHELLSHPSWGHAFPYVPGDASVDGAFARIVTFLKKHV
jgi:acetyl esterase/lipase